MIDMLLLAFACYFALLFAIGMVAHRQQKNAADFIVGGRRLNFWLTAFSAHASDMSAWLFMAFPAAVYIGGWGQLWMAAGLVLGMWSTWQWVAIPLRVQTERTESYTLSMFLERRFDDPSGMLRSSSAVIILFFLASYLASGLVAMGMMIESLFGIHYVVGLCFSTAVVISYTLFGGFFTVACTDSFQAVFLLIAVVLVPWYALGGVLAEGKATLDQLLTAAPSLSMGWVDGFLLATGWGLGYFGQPHIITKFLGIRSPSDLRKSKWVGISWQVIALSGSAFVGAVGWVFFTNPVPDPQLLFFEMVRSSFPPFTAGFILCAVLAAIISTMDSQILVSAAVLSEDIYCRLINPQATQKKILLMTRFSVVLVGIMALFFAVQKNSTILAIVFYAWAGLGSAFGPLILFSLYSRHTTRQGALAGMLFGGVLAALWPTLDTRWFHTELPTMVVVFPLNCAIIWSVSRWSRSVLPRST